MKKYLAIFAPFIIQVIVYLVTMMNMNFKIQASAIMGVGVLMFVFAITDLVKIRKKQIDRFDKMYIPLLGIIFGYCLVSQLAFPLLIWKIDFMPHFWFLLAGIYCILVGNLMPKLPFKSLMGYVSLWVFKSENIFRKSMRLGGIFCILLGMLFVITAFLSLHLMLIASCATMVLLILGTIYLGFYSRRLYLNEKNASAK